MTVNDLLKRLKPEDYDKVITLGDYKIGWTNISGKIKITVSTISIYKHDNVIFSDDK